MRLLRTCIAACLLIVVPCSAQSYQRPEQYNKLLNTIDAVARWFGFQSAKRSERFRDGQPRVGNVWMMGFNDRRPRRLNDELGFRWPISSLDASDARVYAAREGKLWQIPLNGDPAKPVAPLPAGGLVAGLLSCQGHEVGILTQAAEVHLIDPRDGSSHQLGSISVRDMARLQDASRTCNGKTLLELPGYARTDIVAVTDQGDDVITATLPTSRHWDPSFTSDCAGVLFVSPVAAKEAPPPQRIPPPTGCTCSIECPQSPLWSEGVFVAFVSLVLVVRRRLKSWPSVE